MVTTRGERSRRSLLVVVLAFAFSGIAGWSQPQVALAYTCGSGGPGQTSATCYARHEWQGGTTGAATWIDLRNNWSYNSGSNYVSNQLWLLDINTGSCTLSNPCWVEGGYLMQGGQLKYFFADKRPGYGFSYNPLFSVPSADFSTTAPRIKLSFWKNPTSYSLFFDSQSTAPGSTHFTAYSQPNTMDPERIRIGMALTGSSGAVATHSVLHQNRWRDSQANWHFQVRDGDISSAANPPHGWWVNGASPSQISGGGVWWTCSYYPC